MLNIGSLILGIGAWVFAGFAIVAPMASASRKHTVVSFGSCVIALLLQLLEINRRVVLGDYAAIEDTIGAILLASIVLIAVTILLNLWALLRTKDQ